MTLRCHGDNLEAVEESYHQQLARGETVCPPPNIPKIVALGTARFCPHGATTHMQGSVIHRGWMA
jgi:hypothetical protein